MDMIFIEGIAAMAASLLVFFGSVFLLMAVVMGPRLSYFITATVSLGFLLIMGAVWSLSPLGPVGEMPDWDDLAAGTSAADIDFAAAASYPGSPWREPDVEDEHEQALAAELETNSADLLGDAISAGEIEGYETAAELTLDPELTRFIEVEGEMFGAVTYTPEEAGAGEDVIVVMEHDEGNPLGPARMITAGTALLFVGHLFGLSRAERRARSRREAPPA